MTRIEQAQRFDELNTALAIQFGFHNTTQVLVPTSLGHKPHDQCLVINSHGICTALLGSGILSKLKDYGALQQIPRLKLSWRDPSACW